MWTTIERSEGRASEEITETVHLKIGDRGVLRVVEEERGIAMVATSAAIASGVGTMSFKVSYVFSFRSFA